KVATITLLGNETAIRQTAARADLTLDGVKLIDPPTQPSLAEYARILHERRRSHGLTLDEAVELARRPLYFAALSVAANDADGCVGGAANTTGETIRAALQCIGLSPRAKILSSFFLMVLPDAVQNGSSQTLIF